MATGGEAATAGQRPTLVGRRVKVRPGRPEDAPELHAILAEQSVARWWGEPDPVTTIEQDLRGGGSSVLLVIEIDGQVAGGIQYHEENDPKYRHAGIDIYLAGLYQGQGAGSEAVGMLARYLFEQRGHHRITIDPAVGNDRAIRSYTKVGFRPVGVMRQYERGDDGRFHDGLLMDLLRGELLPMTSEGPFVAGRPTRCSGVYVMHWEAPRFVVRVRRRLFGYRSVRCELVAADGLPQNPLQVLGERLPEDFRHYAGLSFDVIVDVTPLEEGRFGHRGSLRWRLRVDQWVKVSKVENERSSGDG